MKYTFLTILLLLSSCLSQDDKKMISDCDGLSMKFYRGLPRPSKLYKEHCKKKESQLEYSPDKCQKAMGQLMLYGSQEKLQKMFGPRIMECFNKGDLQRFLLTPKEKP